MLTEACMGLHTEQERSSLDLNYLIKHSNETMSLQSLRVKHLHVRWHRL